jgi:membrane protease subunit (stomatin/prohibitin family)
MGLWDKIRGEFIDIIEWTDPSQDTIIYRFERHGNEIKYGAQLTVRESQVAVFVNEGRFETRGNDPAGDVFRPGRYLLETQNMPVLTTLKGWKYGFNSPFKAEVYFVNTKHFINMTWGTKNPFTMMDPMLNRPVRIKAFGTYCFRVKDPLLLIKDIAGTDGHFTTDEIGDQLRNIIITRFTDTLASSGIPVFQLAQNYNELSEKLVQNINRDFEEIGLEVTKFFVENISFPPEIEAAIDKSGGISILGDLNAFNQYQMGLSMEKGAENPSGGASDGIGMGMGFAMANKLAQPAGQPAQSPQGPPPLPQALTYYVAVNGQQSGPFDMTVLKNMANSGSLTRNTLVWKQGMSNWLAAEQTDDLKSLFPQLPPPLPQ